MKTNYSFARLIDHVPEYAKTPLRVVEHHHEEYDVDVIDPETGEPTGEKEHVVNDWATYRTEIHPTAADYAQMGWLPVVDKAPTPDPGYAVRKTGLADEVDGRIVMRYEQVLQVHTYRRSYLAQWMLAHDRWYSFKTIVQSDPDLAFFWETSTEFDSDHPRWAEILAGLKTALQLADEDVAEMLAYGESGPS